MIKIMNIHQRTYGLFNLAVVQKEIEIYNYVL